MMPLKTRWLASCSIHRSLWYKWNEICYHMNKHNLCAGTIDVYELDIVRASLIFSRTRWLGMYKGLGGLEKQYVYPFEYVASKTVSLSPE